MSDQFIPKEESIAKQEVQNISKELKIDLNFVMRAGVCVYPLDCI